jgi:ATP-dependent Lon protease
VDVPEPVTTAGSQLLPVLPLKDVCLFPGASLALVVDRPPAISAIRVSTRTGGTLLALGQRDVGATTPGPRDLQTLGTLAAIREANAMSPLELRVELDGIARARVVTLVGVDLLVAEAETVPEGDEGAEWGPAVEALARYLHTHADLRAFLEQQRRSADAMSWVNLACQHLPITVSARQRLLEANAADRCLRISRGLDALLRKEHGA